MKILYGVQGTGNGHITRARVMAQRLADADIDVDFLFSGRPRELYFDMDVFGDCQYRRGFSFSTNAGKVSYIKTALSNSSLGFISEVRSLQVAQYDFIITDFEPITAWAGKLKNKRVIGLGHQYAFAYPVPVSGEDMLSRLLLRHFAPADIRIGLHWDSFGSPILPPIIDHQITRTMNENKARPTILVYLPFEDQARVTELLKEFTTHDFVQYAPNLSNQELNNISLRKTCHDGFKQDLVSADGVICNAGFELISECLHIGMPILAKPLDKQMEQLSNASALEALGYASTMPRLSASSMSNWLNQNNLKKRCNYPDVAGAIVKWIKSGNQHSVERLSTTLWGQCHYA